MNVRKVILSEPKLKLLGAAEQLVAERGFDAVSVRDITQMASANVAAVNYHFGSRDGLLELVVSRFYVPYAEECQMRLTLLEKKGVAAEEVLEAFARPLISVAGKSGLGEAHFCCLAGRVLALPDSQFPAELVEGKRGLHERFVKLLQKAVPQLGEKELRGRFHLLTGALAQGLIHREVVPGAGEATLEEVVGAFLRLAAAAMQSGLVAHVSKGAQKPSAPSGEAPLELFDF